MAKPNKEWKKFWLSFMAAFVFIWFGTFGFIILINPYNHFDFPPKWSNAQFIVNQRFAYPAIAKNQAFDSLVIGTSTMALLQPDILNKKLDRKFAQLSMYNATPFEKFQIFKIFTRSKDRVKEIILGADNWCVFNNEIIYSNREFPHWMYDENIFNDFLPHLNLNAVETSLKKLLFLFGGREAQYQENGYRNFLLPDTQYDINRAQQLIYKHDRSQPLIKDRVKLEEISNEFSNKKMHTGKYIRKILDLINPETRLTLVFTPKHYTTHPAKGSAKWVIRNECLKKIVNLTASHQNTVILDFMIQSPFTINDQNYWDPQHYRIGPAKELTNEIVEGILGKETSLIFRKLEKPNLE